MILTGSCNTLVPGQITTTVDHNSDYSTVTYANLPGFVAPTTVTADQYREAVRFFLSADHNVLSYGPGTVRP